MFSSTPAVTSRPLHRKHSCKPSLANERHPKQLVWQQRGLHWHHPLTAANPTLHRTPVSQMLPTIHAPTTAPTLTATADAIAAPAPPDPGQAATAAAVAAATAAAAAAAGAATAPTATVVQHLLPGHPKFHHPSHPTVCPIPGSSEELWHP